MNEKQLIQALGFKPKDNTSGIFFKKYNNYSIEVDFEKKQFDFGNKITAGRETTQNFSQSENWVVLECVNRLLEKGYKPENIILEKKYKVGHGASGGWLDILVTRKSTKKRSKNYIKTEGNYLPIFKMIEMQNC